MSTADITLISGLPGSGKSLRCIRLMLDAVGEGLNVYACNFNGLDVPGVIKWADPRAWEELPPGSILFIDEAQHFFPMRRSGEPPSYIAAMNTVRHKGVRLVLVSQHPNYLDTHVRGLIGRHEHLVRLNGKLSSKMYASNEVMQDPTSKKARTADDVDRTTWKLDPSLFGYYKSAEVHTRKYVMPDRAKKGLLLFAGTAVLVGLCVMIVRHRMQANAHVETKQPAGAVAAALPPSGAGGQGRPKYATTDEYVHAFIPRMAGRPWSAPIYDNLQVTATPDLLCAVTGIGKESTCHCYTEQATPYVGVTDQQCRMFARDGIYNPFRAHPDAAVVGQVAQAPAQGDDRTGSGHSAGPAGASGAYGRIAPYGQMHTETAGGDPDYKADHF